jgi:glycosyltransferase involved in cell wall biosynthesis
MRLLILTQVIDQKDPALGFFHRWVEEFAHAVTSVEVLCLREGMHTLPSNVRVWSLGKEQGVGRIGYILRFYGFIWAHRNDYDAVFIHMNSEYLVLGGVLWRALGKKTLLWHTHKSMNLIHRIGEKLVDVVATASPESYRLASRKLHVLGHGIDTDAFVPGGPHEDDIFQVLTTGRIARVKGLDILIEGVAGLVKKGVPTELLIIGGPVTKDDEVYLEELKKRVTEHSLDASVRFVGSVSHEEILPYLKRADAFVNCSRTGSLDKAVLEAMAVGLPVITSNDGLTSALGASADTLMFRPGDSEGLIGRLSHIAALPKDEHDALSKGLRTIVVEHHSLQRLVPRMVELIQ